MAEGESLDLSYNDPIELSLFSDLNATCVRGDLFNDTVLNPHWRLFSRYTTNPGIIALQVMMLSGGMLLNGLVTIALMKNSSWRPFYLLLLNLAAVDLCIAVISIGFNVVIGSIGLHNLGSSDYFICHICKLSVLFVCLKLLSVFTLCLLAMDRFVWFYSPARYNDSTNVGTTALAIVAIWIVSTIYLIPPLVGYGDSIFVVPCGLVFLTNSHVDRSAIYLLAIGISMLMVILILVATTVVVWGKTVRILRANSCRTLPQEDNDTMKRIVQQKIKIEIKHQLRLYGAFGGIVFVDVTTYLVAIVLMGYFSSVLYYQLLDAALIDVLLPTIFHPLIIAFLVPELHFKQVCTPLCKKKPGKTTSKEGTKVEENKVREDLDEKGVVVEGEEKIKAEEVETKRKVVEGTLVEDKIKGMEVVDKVVLGEQKVKKKFKLFGRKGREGKGDSEKNTLEKCKDDKKEDKETKKEECKGNMGGNVEKTKEKVEDKTELDEQKVLESTVVDAKIKSEDKKELDKNKVEDQEARKVKEDKDKKMTTANKKEVDFTLSQSETHDGKKKRKFKLFGRKERERKEASEKNAFGNSKDGKEANIFDEDKEKKGQGKADASGKEVEKTEVEAKDEQKVIDSAVVEKSIRSEDKNELDKKKVEDKDAMKVEETEKEITKEVTDTKVDHSLSQRQTQDGKDTKGKSKFKLLGRKKEQSKEKGEKVINAYGDKEASKGGEPDLREDVKKIDKEETGKDQEKIEESKKEEKEEMEAPKLMTAKDRKGELNLVLHQGETQDGKDTKGKRKFKLFGGRKKSKEREEKGGLDNSAKKSEDGERTGNLDEEEKETKKEEKETKKEEEIKKSRNSGEDVFGKTKISEENLIKVHEKTDVDEKKGKEKEERMKTKEVFEMTGKGEMDLTLPQSESPDSTGMSGKEEREVKREAEGKKFIDCEETGDSNKKEDSGGEACKGISDQ